MLTSVSVSDCLAANRHDDYSNKNDKCGRVTNKWIDVRRWAPPLLSALMAALCVTVLARSAEAQAHPRIWLTPTLLSDLVAKKNANDADWIRVKASADSVLSVTMPSFTFTAATNSNPVQFTITENVPWSSSMQVYIGGGTGSWAGVNSQSTRTATKTGTHTFTVPVDSSAFGSFSGQKFALFPYDGNAGLDYARYSFQGFGWNDLYALGLAYQITGNVAYATKARQLLDYIISLGVAGILAPIAIDSGYPSRSAIYYLALGYDWIYDQLSAQEKADAATAINLWYDWFKANALEKTGPATGNYFGGHVKGFGMAAFATAGDNGRSSEIKTYIRDLWDAQVAVAFMAGAFRGGFPSEAYVYGANNLRGYMEYMLATKTATGEDLFATTPYAQKIATSLIYNLKPNRWQVPDEADYAGDYVGVLQPTTLPLFLSHALNGTTEGGWMQHLYANLAVSPYGGQVDNPLDRFLFAKAGRADIDYTATAPLFYHSAGDEHMLWRSGWGTNAVWAQLNGGSTNWAQAAGGGGSSHQSRAAGNIEIQRGSDYFLVNSGQFKGASGVTGTPASFSTLGWRANTLYHYDSGAYNFTGANYVGGQGLWGTTDIRAQEGGAGYAYMKADLTSAYYTNDAPPHSGRTLTVYQRSTMMEGSGIVVIFDRATLSRTGFTDKLYFHFNPNGTLTTSSATTKSVLGSSVLFLKTLSPANPTIAMTTDPVNDDGSGGVVTKRLEVSDASPTTSFQGLHVAFAMDSGQTSMPTTTKITTLEGYMVGASMIDGGTTWVNLFSVDGTPQSLLTYTATIASTGRHVLADLTPDMIFNVKQNGTLITTQPASLQGVISFSSAGGGTFEVRGAGIVDRPRAPGNVRFPGASKPTITSFTATPVTLPPGGGTVTLSWQVSQATGVTIDGGIGAVTSNNSTTVTVRSTKVFTLSATSVAGTVTASASIVVGQPPGTSGARFVAMVAPASGETFTAPATLRFVAAARDPNVFNNSPSAGLGGNAASVQIFVDNAVALTVDGSQAEYWVFKGFAGNIPAGSHRVWARATYTNPSLVLDSAPVTINVAAPPTYASVVDLTADVTVAGAYSLVGTGAGRVRVNGNGHRIISAAGGSGAITFQHVDFFDLGDRNSTQSAGIDLTTSGGLTVEDCIFDGSNPVQVTLQGAAGARVVGNTFRSNMRQPLGQYPDGSNGVAHGSFPVAILQGMSTGSKVFQGNNVGAGWIQFASTQGWLVGGDNDADGNILMGPRVGIFLSQSQNIQIRRNYSHHIYYGGWSQGSNFELGDTASLTAEHNVIVGSSWPVRGTAGEFRYNLVLGIGGEEGLIWLKTNAANVHHNVFRAWVTRGALYGIYGAAGAAIRNNTFDGVDKDQSSAVELMTLSSGTTTVNSNLLFNGPARTVTIAGTGSVTADYNGFFQNNRPNYSDGRVSAHDVSGLDPLLTSPPTTAIPFDIGSVWQRSLTARTILSNFRAYYTPAAGSPLLGTGDPAIFGSGNHIGGVGSGTNAADLFGR